MRSARLAAVIGLALIWSAASHAQSNNAGDAVPVTVAAGKSTAYEGTWAEDPTQCGKEQDVEDAPMVMGRGRFDQHEAHCTFKSISGNANEWKVTAECSVEGDSQAYEFGMSVADKQLAMVDDAGTHIYARCE